MRGTSAGRRRALAALACLPLAACAPPRAAVIEEPPPLLPPREAAGALLLVLVPGLGLDNVLLGVGEGDLPHLARVLGRGTLVETIRPVDDIFLAPAELARALVDGLDCPFVTGGCLNDGYDLEPGEAEACSRPASAGDALEAWLASLDAALDAAEGLLAGADPICQALLLDGLLPLETGYLVADPAQPGYGAEAALAYAALWTTALRALDAGLGRLLRQVDLATGTLVLAATADVWAVHARLDPAEVLGPTTVLAGGALLESEAGLALPEGEAWQQVRVGRAPGPNGGVRLLAPPGHAFAAADGLLPRAVPRPGGFLLGLGRGLAEGSRLKSMAPEWAAGLLRDLRNRDGTDTEASGA